jgi:hypothetical protein
MNRELGASIMLVSILSIVALSLVLWMFSLVRFLIQFLRSSDPHRYESPGDDPPIDDPYDVGINDKDIL